MDNPDLMYLINNFVGYEKLIDEKQETIDRCAKCLIYLGVDFLDNETQKNAMQLMAHARCIIQDYGPTLFKTICLAELQRNVLLPKVNINCRKSKREYLKAYNKMNIRIHNMMFCSDVLHSINWRKKLPI